MLDIFYEEFIKFVPSYVLKREEEKRPDLNTALQQQLELSPSQALLHSNQQQSLFRRKTQRKKLTNVNEQVH